MSVGAILACNDPDDPYDPYNPDDGGDDQTAALESISLDAQSIELQMGQRQQLKVTYHPDNAERLELEWKTDPVGVVSVSQEGLVQADNPGSATVTVVAKMRPEVYATCAITVLSPERAKGIISADDFGHQGECTDAEKQSGSDYSYAFSPWAAQVSGEAVEHIINLDEGAQRRFSLPATQDSYYGSSSCLVKGDVIVIPDCEQYPGGAALKVIDYLPASRTGDGETITYVARDASLTEVFQNLNLEQKDVNISGAIQSIVDEDGNPVEFANTKGRGGFEIAIPDLFGTDVSLDFGDNLSVTPKVKVQFTMDMAVNIVDYNLTYARTRVDASADLQADISLHSKAEKTFKSKQLKVTLGAVVVGPLVITPEVYVQFELKLTGQVDLTFSVSYQKSYYALAFYNGAELLTRCGEAQVPDPRDPFSVSGSLSGSVEFGPNIGFAVSLYKGALELGVDFDPHMVFTVFSSYPLNKDALTNLTDGGTWLSNAGYEPSLSFKFGGYGRMAYAWDFDFHLPEEIGLSYSFGKTYIIPQVSKTPTMNFTGTSSTISTAIKNKAMQVGEMFYKAELIKAGGSGVEKTIKIPVSVEGEPTNDDDAPCEAVLDMEAGRTYSVTGPYMDVMLFGGLYEVRMAGGLYRKQVYTVEPKLEKAIRAILADILKSRVGEWKGCNWEDEGVSFMDLKNVSYYKYSDEEFARSRELWGDWAYSQQITIKLPEDWKVSKSITIENHSENVQDMGWELDIYSQTDFDDILIEDPNFLEGGSPQGYAIWPANTRLEIHSPRFHRYRSSIANQSFPVNPEHKDVYVDLSGSGVPVFDAAFDSERYSGNNVCFTGTIILDNCTELLGIELGTELPAMLSFQGCPTLDELIVEDCPDVSPLSTYKGKVKRLFIGGSSGGNLELSAESGLNISERINIYTDKSVPMDVSLSGYNLYPKSGSALSFILEGDVNIQACQLSGYYFADDLQATNVDISGCTYTDTSTDYEYFHTSSIVFRTRESVTVSNLTTNKRLAIFVYDTKKVDLSSCPELAVLAIDENLVSPWLGPLESWSITDCDLMTQGKGRISIHSSKVNGLLPELLRNNSGVYPNKYWYEEVKNSDGTYSWRYGNNSNGYYMPGEPGRPYDHTNHKYYN